MRVSFAGILAASLLSLALSSNTGCEGDGAQSELLSNASATDAAADTSSADVMPLPFSMYHRQGVVDPTSLELKKDGTFRWVIHGCDFGGGGVGRWSEEDGAIILVPRADKETFLWPGAHVIRAQSRVVLRASGSELIAETANDGSTSWLPGGSCAECGGSLGPTGSHDCADPFAGRTLPGE